MIGSDFQAVDLTPVVSSLDQSSGPASGGQSVSIQGVNFAGVAGKLQVLFGNTPATNVTVQSDNLLTATAPAGSAGTVDVTVVTPYGTSQTSSTTTYAYVQQTTVSAVSVKTPTSGDIALQTAPDGLRLLPADRNTDLPWVGINHINITLAQPTALSASDVSLHSAAGANYDPVTVAGSGANYTLTLANPLAKSDRVTITIANAGISAWTRRIDVLAGDANDDGIVSFADFVALSTHFGQAASSSPFADFNDDGQINFADFIALSTNFGDSLPLEPTLARSRVNRNYAARR